MLMAVLAPLLWITFSTDLVALGLVAAVVARRPSPTGRLVLLAVTIPPLSAAALQVSYI